MSLISLEGNDWQLGSVYPRELGEIYDLEEVTVWLPATIPGNIRADLAASGKIPDPYIGENLKASEWVDSRDWWYRKRLSFPHIPGDRVHLALEGVDYISAVYLNGKKLGDHTGMFSQQVYEITELLEPENILAVRIKGKQALPKPELTLLERVFKLAGKHLANLNLFPSRMATLRCQMSFGWDFAPENLSGGIWDDISLEISGFALITGLRVTTRMGGEDANVFVELEIDSNRECRLQGIANIQDLGFKHDQEFENTLVIPRGRSTHSMFFSLKQPRNWEPWDRGIPNLYQIDLFLKEGEKTIHSRRVRFGFRTAEISSSPASGNGTAAWTLLVNGEREYIRGANWVPADFLYGKLRREDYRTLIRLARAANINLLRVWGGGLREKKDFYEVCDEEGMLVWQEFPFACSFFDHYPATDAFLALAEQECRDIIRTLRNYPSVVIWCGGNEFNLARNSRLVEMMQRLTAEMDGERPFKAASPSPGDHHNWRVWHGGGNIADYRHEQAQILSEFGLQAVPHMESLKKFLSPVDLVEGKTGWEYHSAEIKKLKRYAPSCKKTEEFSEATQRAQAIGLQTAIEHQRRRKGKTDGVAFWQFNEPWPAISWSVVDYFRRPKQAYYAVQRAYNPVLVSLLYPFKPYKEGGELKGEIWVVNDTREKLEGCRLEILISDHILHRQIVDVLPDCSRQVGNISLILPFAGLLVTRIWHEGRLLGENQYDLSYYDPQQISWRGAFLSWLTWRVLK